MITKSKYMKGEQCLRLLWLAHKKQLPEISLADQHRFDQGGIFEKHVKVLYPKGIELGNLEFNENIEKTKELIKKKKIIFEAGILYKDLFIRADILEPSKDGWNLYEIKSSTSEKKIKIYKVDLAFQKFVLEKAGLKIKKCFVLMLNREYVKNGKINAKELVLKKDITEEVELVEDVEKIANKYLAIIKQGKEPDMIISKNCNQPYKCPLKDKCWGTLPENNVLQLRKWQDYWKFFDQGIIAMKDIPKGTPLTPKDTIIRQGALTKKVVVIKDKIKEFLDSLKYPLYHFDFETFDTAIPIYDNSRPYQKIPFQYSLHIEQKDGKLEHFEYLSDGNEDPRIGLLKQLKNEIEGTGSVIVFNKSFEIGVLKKLAEDFPEHNDWIQDVIDRIIDLALPFQNFYYYCPSQKGSYSIKKVLPAITGKSYDDLEISNGAEASVQYFNSHIKDKLDVKEKLRKDLLKYCCLDTEGMVCILKGLKKLIRK
ncbi:DUF2779 domain-containing protein [Nanoarchaeota archaeon]